MKSKFALFRPCHIPLCCIFAFASAIYRPEAALTLSLTGLNGSQLSADFKGKHVVLEWNKL